MNTNQNSSLALRKYGPFVAVAGVALSAGLLVYSAVGSPPKANEPSMGGSVGTNTYEEARQLLAKASALLDTAAKDLEKGQAETALSGLDKSERLIGAARHMAGRNERTLPSRHPALRQPPINLFMDPWNDEDFWSGDPFAQLHQVRRQFENLFGDNLNQMGSIGFSPRVDVSDEGKRYVVKYDLPEVDKDKIKVTVEGDVLTVSGESGQQVERKEDGKASYTEQSYGQFQRSITLPGPVDAAKLEAKYDKGVLRVFVPNPSSTV